MDKTKTSGSGRASQGLRLLCTELADTAPTQLADTKRAMISSNVSCMVVSELELVSRRRSERIRQKFYNTSDGRLLR